MGQCQLVLPNPRTTLRKCMAVSAVVMPCVLVPLSAKAAPCDPMDPRAKVSNSVEGEIKGSIAALLRQISGSGQIVAKVEREVKNLSDKSPVGDRALIDARYQYLLCLSLLEPNGAFRKDAADILMKLEERRSARERQASTQAPERQQPGERQPPAPRPKQDRPPAAAPEAKPAASIDNRGGVNIGSIGSISGAGPVILGSNNTVTQEVTRKSDPTVLSVQFEEVRRARIAASLADAEALYPADWNLAEELFARGSDLYAKSEAGAQEALENALVRFRDMKARATRDVALADARVKQDDMRSRRDRNQVLQDASTAATQAHSRATRKQHKTAEERELYRAASMKLDEARGLGRRRDTLEGRTDTYDEALRLYEEARQMWDQIK